MKLTPCQGIENALPAESDGARPIRANPVGSSQRICSGRSLPQFALAKRANSCSVKRRVDSVNSVSA